MAGVLLPVANILQAFTDSGSVLAGGFIYTYAAGSTTPQATYKEQALSNLHDNPITLDSYGRLTSPVWGTAGNTFKFRFKTSAGVQIGPDFDNVPGINDNSALGVQYWAGTSGGTANAQTLTFSGGPTTLQQGVEIIWKAGNTNTSSMTLNPNGLGAVTCKKKNARDLIGGEVISNRWYRSLYDGTYWLTQALDNQQANRVDVASAATVDLDATDSEYVRITGSTGPITAITLSNGRECDVVFASTPTLTNSSSLILPNSADILAYAGLTLRFRGEASSVVRCISPTPVVANLIATSAINTGRTLINGTLTATVGSNALTIAIKTLAGTDPSSSDPVHVVFHNATIATGDYSVLTLTSALSLVVSSGSTLGTANATAHRLYVGICNDASTARLFVYNPLKSSDLSLIGLREGTLYSSTAEGGAGAADSAQVLYSGTAFTSKAIAVVGYVESTQATAGTWATSPSAIHLLTGQSRRTGDVVQLQSNSSGAVTTTTTVIPNDDSIPQITEGKELLTQAITPSSAINLLEINHTGNYSVAATAQELICALFQDATANALAAMAQHSSTGAIMGSMSLRHLMQAGTTSSTTFRLRAGPGIGSTLTFNGVSGGRLFGGVAASYLRVAEIFV